MADKPEGGKIREIRVGGKSFKAIRDTAKRFDADKEKPTVNHSQADKQRRKLENLMKKIDKPVHIPGLVRLLVQISRFVSCITYYQ